MPTLYDIDRRIMECVDTETGEIIDPDKLDALAMERTAKIENIALYVKNLKAAAAALKAEKDAFAKREATAQKNIERLERYLFTALGGEEFEATRCTVKWRRSERVDIADDTTVPKAYLRKTVVLKPDKDAIKAAIKEGRKVRGCRLIENLNAQIK